LKAVQPKLRILLGGPEITSDNRWVLEHPAIDLAAIGEGEQTFVDLLSALDAGRSTENIRGAMEPRRQPAAATPGVRDLDLVSSPYIEGILNACEEHTMLMETSRGCRYRCKFCYYPKSYDSIYRMSVGQIEANLRHACHRGVKEVYLLDPRSTNGPTSPASSACWPKAIPTASSRTRLKLRRKAFVPRPPGCFARPTSRRLKSACNRSTPRPKN